MTCSVEITNLPEVLARLYIKIKRRDDEAERKKEEFIADYTKRRNFPCFWRCNTREEAIYEYREDWGYLARSPYRWREMEEFLTKAIQSGAKSVTITEDKLDILDF